MTNTSLPFEHLRPPEDDNEGNHFGPPRSDDTLLAPEDRDFPEQRWFHPPLALQALLLTTIRVIGGLVLARVALSRFSSGHVSSSVNDAGVQFAHNPGGGTLGHSFFHWDAINYLFVSAQGYPESMQFASWFPVFPGLGRLVEKITPLSPTWSLLVVCWVSMFFAIWAVMAIVKRLWPNVSPIWVATFVAWGPVSVFLMSGYPTALLMALSGWFFYMTLRKQWFVAALIAAIASATRPEGALLGICLAVGLLVDRKAVRALLGFLISEIGFFGFLVFQKVRFGNPFAFVQTQLDSGRNLGAPFATAFSDLKRTFSGLFTNHAAMTSDERFIVPLNVLFVAIAVGLTLWLVVSTFRDVRLIPMMLFALICSVLLLCLGASNMQDGSGNARQLVPQLTFALVPQYVLLARIRHSFVMASALAIAVALGVTMQIAYVLG